MVRFTDQESGACVAHRCDDHGTVPPINSHGPDKSECALCVAQALVEGYEKAFERRVFWPTIESARDRLNLLAPGSGNRFLEDARAILNSASIDDEAPDE